MARPQTLIDFETWLASPGRKSNEDIVARVEAVYADGVRLAGPHLRKHLVGVGTPQALAMARLIDEFENNDDQFFTDFPASVREPVRLIKEVDVPEFEEFRRKPIG